MSIERIIAAQTYSPKKKEGSSFAKTAATAVSTTAAAGAVLYMAKTGKLNPQEGGNKVVEGLKSALKKPSDFVLKKGADLGTKVQQASKVNPKVSAVADKISALSKNIKSVKDSFLASDFKANFNKAVDSVKDFAESKINPEKFVK